MGFFTRRITRHLRAEIENVRADMMQIIGIYLVQKYAPEFEFETAMRLAVAVVNEIFGLPPTNQIGTQFLSANKQLIELHIARIKEEPKICHIVSVLTHSLANLSANTCAITPDMLKSWVKLTDLGILLPIEKISMPSSLDELVQQATKFQAWVAEESHRQAAPEAGGDK